MRTRQFQLLLCLPNHVATFEEILRKACELGIQSIQPLFSERTERLHWSPDVWQQRSERWKRILIEACKQAKNPFLPQLYAPVPLGELQKLPLGHCIHGTLDVASSPSSYPQNASLLKNFSPTPSETVFSCIINRNRRCEFGDDFEGLGWEGAVKFFPCNFFSIFYSLF